MRSNKSIKEGKKEIIIDLRNKGYSYRQIRNETGISNGSISYHAGEGQKEKTIERSERQRKGFKRKVWNFIWGERKKTPKKPFVYGTTEIRKKGREFFYGDKRRKAGQNMKIKKPKIWIYFGKLFPGITSKEKEVQAVNQWTGELDYYDNGEPIMFPFVRGKLTGEIVNIKDNTFLDIEKLRDIFNLGEINSNKIVMSCGSSVSAASLALAYSLINDDYIPKIYIGSWTEFGKK